VKTKTIAIERWIALLEERAELLAFKCRALEQGFRLEPPRTAERISSKAPLPPISDFAIRGLQQKLRNSIEKSGLGLNKWCAANGVHKRDLLWLSKHFERSANGEATISRNKLDELLARFPDSGKAAQ